VSQHPNSWIQELYAHLNWQTEQINQLQKQTDKLQTEVELLKKQKHISVEKIEYKFDQLKVETLHGTLHIGVTPNMEKTIEEAAVNGKELSVSEEQAESHPKGE
jgi:spore germination protein PC